MNQDVFERRRQRKLARNPCPGCGQHTGTGYVWCRDCRERKAHPVPAKAEFPKRLPVAPLYAIVKRYVELNAQPHPHSGAPNVGPVLEGLGLCSRRYFEWNKERSRLVSFDIADRVLTALSLDFRDVWADYPDVIACLDAIDAVEAA